MFQREVATDPAIVDEWEAGVGWIAHPDESGLRASYAFAFDDGVWLVDPLDAAGIGDRIDALGAVVGVTVCSSWHARDADVFAASYDVPISIHESMRRIEGITESPIRRYGSTLDDAGVRVFDRHPFPLADEAILFHDRTGTLYVPDTLGTTPDHTVGGERIGFEPFTRLSPPTELLDLQPSRICCGHGEGISSGATAALEDAITNGRRRFPRAVVANGPGRMRIAIAAVRR